jgi:glucose-6-phosphate 1-dehydrogenase
MSTRAIQNQRFRERLLTLRRPSHEAERVWDSMRLENSLQDVPHFEQGLPACTVVIFGADGDLMKRKLMPALYRLAYDRRLSADFAVLGTSRTALSDEQFRAKMLDAVKQFSEDTNFDEYVWRAFASSLSYVAGDIDDPQLFRNLHSRLAQIKADRHTNGNVVFYLALQPSKYAVAARNLGSVRLGDGEGWRRLIVEKPFGLSVVTARELSDQLHEVFDESEIYRMDHYLGKEALQNILAFRFGSGIFEPLWSRRYINHVQITAAESVGVEGRAAYYQETGALADMIQNHLLQIMATIGMEPPSTSFNATSVHDEKYKLLRSIKPMKVAEIRRESVLGQYGPGRIGGQDVPGFRQEPNVDSGAQTETFAALTLFIENRRWAGVPFYLRTGKRMHTRGTEVVVQLNEGQVAITDGANLENASNQLIFRIQPEESISLKFLSKRPGPGMALRPASMDFRHDSTSGERSPSAYENALLDAIAGDTSLYTRQDMVEAGWSVVEPIRTTWREMRFDFPNYSAGSWGPAAADEMLARRGHVWRNP